MPMPASMIVKGSHERANLPVHSRAQPIKLYANVAVFTIARLPVASNSRPQRFSKGKAMNNAEGRLVPRTIRRQQLREIVPLADSPIYKMEQRGEFPRRFALTPRCVVWDIGEIQAWLWSQRCLGQRRGSVCAPWSAKTDQAWHRWCA